MLCASDSKIYPGENNNSVQGIDKLLFVGFLIYLMKFSPLCIHIIFVIYMLNLEIDENITIIKVLHKI